MEGRIDRPRDSRAQMILGKPQKDSVQTTDLNTALGLEATAECQLSDLRKDDQQPEVTNSATCSTRRPSPASEDRKSFFSETL